MGEEVQPEAQIPESADSSIAPHIESCREEPCVAEEGYDYDEFVEVIHAILWDILDQRRPLLRRLLHAKKLIDDPPPQPKRSTVSKRTPPADGKTLLEDIVKEILTIDQELNNVDREILDAQLFELCSNPPPVPPSPLQLMLLTKSEKTNVFEHHAILSTIFSYLDMKSLLTFSETSKLSHDAVDTYTRKAAYQMMLHSGPVRNNLNYWREMVEQFFTNLVTLQPVSRSNYLPIQTQLRMNRNVFPINDESMKSHTYVSFDYIKPHYIVYCDHEKPMAHTCKASRAIDCDTKAVTKQITLNDFIVEYSKRLEVQDPESPCWGVPPSMITPEYVALMLKVTLGTISQCITKHAGLVEFRRTEYTANATHHITHRIWLQLSLMWDFRFGENAQNSLFLNIFDHFTWDA
ncbi:hypothetical protein BaOVIS_008440 [Babesia ovis]|uniref:F-box domain-containing protein n=1 Tax=Babesia ovis TaxID=5869 RepID=A0A9W5T8R8_BABOV|nr:hypothetical protein BaOVIS_008440 [Babesia ovis]